MEIISTMGPATSALSSGRKPTIREAILEARITGVSVPMLMMAANADEIEEFSKQHMEDYEEWKKDER